MKTRLAKKIIKNPSRYSQNRIILAQKIIGIEVAQSRIRFIRISCPNNPIHEFFRYQRTCYYQYIPSNLKLNDFRCTGKNSLDPFGPDSCHQTPIKSKV